MRRTGIDVIGDVPWGTHFCQFYETSRDLVETLVPYFREGLAANEFCMWVTSAPLGVEEAKAALKGAVPNLDKFIAKGQIEILDYSQWYTRSGEFSADEVLKGWVDKLTAALEKGYEGLRLTGNTFWLEKANWDDFAKYEEAVNTVIGQYKMLAICSYSLEKCGATEIVDVIANHQFALIKRRGSWETIESSRHKEDRRRADEALRRAKEDWERTFNSVPDLIAILDKDHRIVRVNKALADRLGVTPEAAVGLHCYETVHGTSAPPEFCPHVLTCRDGQEHVAEVHEPRLGGDFIVSTTPLCDAEGELAGSVHVARDITERKRAEAQRQRLASFPELNPNPVVEVETSGKVSYLNPAAREAFSDLEEARLEHPLLRGLRTMFEDLEAGRKSVATAEAAVGERHFLVSLYYVADLKRVRIYARDITERKRAEQALLESEADLNRAQAVAHTGSWRLDVRRNELVWSEETHRIFGIPKGTPLTYETFLGAVHPEDRERVDRMWRGAMRGEPYDIEHRIVVGDAVKWIRERAELEFDAQGTLRGGFGTAQDITERKRTGEAIQQHARELQELNETLEERVKERTARLAEANEIMESIFSNVHFLVAYMDRDFNFIRVNRAYAEADGNPPEFYAGQNHFALFPDEENETIFRRVVETGEPFVAHEKPFEYTGHPKRGVSYWDWRLHPVKGADGRVNGLILSLIDVTRRKLAEQERLRLVAAVEQAGEGIAITDPKGIIAYVNPAFEEMTGLGRQNLLGACYYNFLNSGEGLGEKIQETVSKGETWSGHFTRKGTSGRSCEVKAVVSPIRDSSGGVINYLAVERDETQDVRQQQYMRQMQKMEALGTLAGGIAHDFNNILNPIFINTELALLDASLDSQKRGYLDIALKAAERGRELVRQIITFSRQKEKERKPLKAGPVIKEALLLLEASLPKTVEIRKKIQDETGFVTADSTEIYQVVMNLCSNAAYAMREKGGALEVSLAEVEVDADMVLRHPDLKPGPHLRLTVADTGTGMTQEVLERAFDPFFTTKKPGEGTGMGLAAVHGIVRDLGGGVTVYSEVGRGSTFSVFLPHMESAAAPKGVSPAPIVTGEGSILLVDDEEAQVLSIRNMLQRLGYDVETRTNAGEALTLFSKDPMKFDLVITDQTMPQMTGAILAQELLRMRPDLPIILCTGFSEMMDAEGALALGISQFLMKPFSIREMAETVRLALEKKKRGA